MQRSKSRDHNRHSSTSHPQHDVHDRDHSDCGRSHEHEKRASRSMSRSHNHSEHSHSHHRRGSSRDSRRDNQSPQIVAPEPAVDPAIMAGLGLRDHHSNTDHGAYDPGQDTSRDHDGVRLQNQRSHGSQRSQHRHSPTGSRSRSRGVKQHTSITSATPTDMKLVDGLVKLNQ